MNVHRLWSGTVLVLAATGLQVYAGGASVNAPVSVRATINGGDNWSAADRQAFAREFAESLRDGVDIMYTSRGVT